MGWGLSAEGVERGISESPSGKESLFETLLPEMTEPTVATESIDARIAHRPPIADTSEAGEVESDSGDINREYDGDGTNGEDGRDAAGT